MGSPRDILIGFGRSLASKVSLPGLTVLAYMAYEAIPEENTYLKAGAAAALLFIAMPVATKLAKVSGEEVKFDSAKNEAKQFAADGLGTSVAGLAAAGFQGAVELASNSNPTTKLIAVGAGVVTGTLAKAGLTGYWERSAEASNSASAALLPSSPTNKV